MNPLTGLRSGEGDAVAAAGACATCGEGVRVPASLRCASGDPAMRSKYRRADRPGDLAADSAGAGAGADARPARPARSSEPLGSLRARRQRGLGDFGDLFADSPSTPRERQRREK